MDIAFVILHYMAIEETNRCIEYIRKNIDTKNYKIIVVDNASPNGSGKDISQKYKEDKDVTVILNSNNLGFAKGNNVGFKYAAEMWNPEYVILLNNDVYLLEKNLKEKLDKEYEDNKFAVLGPLIMTGDGKCNVNPIRQSLRSRKEIVHQIKKFERRKKRIKWGVESWYRLLIVTLSSVKKIICGGRNTNKEYLMHKENVQLHGCFLVFSQEYMKVFTGLDDRTFLYGEEEILYKHLMERKLKSVYSPDVLVYHQEDAATDMVIKQEKEKTLFCIDNNIESLKGLLEVYDLYENKR